MCLNLRCQFDCETCERVRRWNQLASDWSVRYNILVEEHFLQISIKYSIIAFFVNTTYEDQILNTPSHLFCATNRDVTSRGTARQIEHLNREFVCSILYSTCSPYLFSNVSKCVSRKKGIYCIPFLECK